MKEIKVNKVLLGPFIDMLVDAYGKGADYIDLVVQKGEYNQDAIGISIPEEYINFERYEEYITSQPIRKNVKMKGLTKKHLNRLNISLN